jgi:enolase-phosphatase E1
LVSRFLIPQHQAKEEAKLPAATEQEELQTAVTTFILQLVAEDRKVTPLKDLQGDLWRHGYQCGDLKGE